MGRTAEGRSELVELADDSASSIDATIPSSPRATRSKVNDGEPRLFLAMLRAERQWNSGITRCKTLEGTNEVHARNNTD